MVKVLEISSDKLTSDHPIRAAWQKLVDESSSLYVLYQSPLWWDHLVGFSDHRQHRLIYCSAENESVGLVMPCFFGDFRPVESAWLGRWHPFAGQAWNILGGEPLISESVNFSVEKFANIFTSRTFNRPVFTKSARLNSILMKLVDHQMVGDLPVVATLEGVSRPLYEISFDGTWSHYFKARFSKKQGYNLKRNFRILQEYLSESLELVPIVNRDCLELFFRRLRPMLPWLRNYHRNRNLDLARLADLSDRGVLRGYSLVARNQLLAFAIGYQYANVYHYADIGFDTRLDRFSPGTVLLVQLLEDLFSRQEVKRFNFGVGQAEYKRRFATGSEQDQSLLITANTWSNRWRGRGLRLANWLAERWRTNRQTND